MIEHISENIQWIFSGVGLVIPPFIVKAVINAKKRKRVDTSNIVSKDFNLKEYTEVSQISKRFKRVLEMMNEDRTHSKFTVTQLAQIMELSKTSELENIFTGKKEPSFKFIERFTKQFGINYSWLSEGKKTPYECDDTSLYYSPDYLELINKYNPTEIIFVKESTIRSAAFILFKLNEWNYIIIKHRWHVSDQVGVGGAKQLVSLYKFIKHLQETTELYIKSSGLLLESKDFERLLNGEKFPGKYTIHSSNNPWWDDLTDIYHQYSIADQYENMHGSSFIKAQNIIKWRIEESCKNDYASHD